MKYKNCPVHFEAKEFKLKNIFKISRGSKSKIRTLELRIAKNHCVGRGECVPYKRYNENLSKITKILRNKKNINNLSSIKSLPLRNALSNAIYDLKLKTKKIKYSNIIKKNNFNTAITIPIYNEKKKLEYFLALEKEIPMENELN